jgi:hypothetical protein
MAKKSSPPINYTDRDFQSIKEGLIEHAKRYYPNTMNDFNEASFGALMMDSVAYIGDILSFYLDYQASESFLDSAIEFKNVIRLAKQMGYKYNPEITAYGHVAMYVKVPATANGLGPDTDYMPVIPRGTRLASESNVPFLTIGDISFSESDSQVLVADVDADTGNPLYYAMKAYAPVVSGDLGVAQLAVGDYTPYKKVQLNVPNLAEIISVIDSEGNEYFQVEYLSQDIVYTSVNNRDNNKNLVPRVFKAISVPRRFVIERTEDDVFLQFGGGANTDTINQNDIKLDPSSVALKMHAKNYISDTSFDPNILVKNNNLGIGPANTTLTVIYRSNLTTIINVGVGDVNQVVNANIVYENPTLLNQGETNKIRASLETFNEDVIVGTANIPTSDEIKILAKHTAAAQNRAVTKQDYISLSYSMPSEFGAIKRCNIVQDRNSFKRNLNMYVVGEGLDGTLMKPDMLLKQNLKNWINQYKMLNDTLDILDGNILNLSIDYIVIPEPGENKYSLKQVIAGALQEFYERPAEIGESFYITDVYNIINEVRGVADVQHVEIGVKSGGLYSSFRIDLEQHTSADGRYITMPDDTVYEVKFIENDIQGTIL